MNTPAMVRLRKWTMGIGVAGLAVFLAAAALATYVGTRLPQHPGSGAGFVAVLIAWHAYLFMSTCTVIALAGMALARFKASLPLGRGGWCYLLGAAVCQLGPVYIFIWPTLV